MDDNPPVPAALLKKTKANEDARRNRLNMEKMIMKNVSGSRSNAKNRTQQILEQFKKKRSQDGTEDERQAKKKKPAEPTARALAAGILSPARRATTGCFAASATAAASATFTSPSRRHSFHPQRSPTPQMLSPARARHSGVPLHLASPVRPPRSTTASPARPKRTGNTASPLRRTEFLTSPLRHRASASPKRPLMFDDASMAAAEASTTSNRINGHPPLLASALDQVELAPQAKSAKSTAKSPFASFQAKFNSSPARVRTTSSPNTSDSGRQIDLTSQGPRSGPTMVDLSHPDDTVAQTNGTVATSATTVAAEPPGSSEAPAHPVPNAHADSLFLLSSQEPPPTAQPPKPARKLFTERPVVAKRSLCFSTEGVASSLDVTPDGEIVVVGFTDGSVRLYEMDSSVPSDRHGYLLGHIDEMSSTGFSVFHLRVKISPDGRYVFVGCRHSLRVVMTINLDHYRNEKEGDDDEFQQFQKHFHSQSRLKGFADVTTYVPPTGSTELQEAKRHAYYVLTGLGVGTLNLWRFVEAERNQDEPIWDHLQAFQAGGNTAMTGVFLPSSTSPGVLAIAAISKEKNLRVWPLEYKNSSPSSASEGNEDSANEMEDVAWIGGVHTVTTHFNIPNTSEIAEIYGQYAYSISLVGEAYRIRLPDAADIASSEGGRFPRQSFELEKLDSSGSGKSRRSNIILESVAASDDGKAIIAVSTEGIFYYSNDLPEVGTSDVADLRIIGKNASENTLFKTPMKVYTPMLTAKGKTTKSETMMAVVTNPSAEDEEEYTGYFNVDPTEVFAARWMVPSRAKNCWVCGVRNVSHWPGPPEPKIKAPSAAALEAEKKEKAKAQRRRERAIRKAEEDAARRASSPETPTSGSTRVTPRSSAKKLKQEPSNGSGAASSSKKRRASRNNDEDDDEDYMPNSKTSSQRASIPADGAPTQLVAVGIATLMSELEHIKKRNVEIKTEWQRRLLGERQLRRKWKQREEEFMEQLNDSLTKLDTAEVEVDRLRVLLRDAEKRFAFEKARVEQENSVKARYEQLCEQMNDRMAMVADQKRLLEQTTRSLLTEVDRNVQALKNSVILEKNECVVCKDKQAVTAIVPCGHLCFCEEDAETYRRNCTSKYPTCPICQQEIVSLLRIYT